MTVPWNAVEPLAEHHPVSEFTSGRESVDAWFREKARGAAHLTAPYVCLDSAGAVCGFFALRAAIVNVSGLPGGLKRAGDAEGLAPAVMLAQMGLHEDHHGGGHGRRLFFRAVQEAAVAHAAVRIRLLVLDAADDSLVPFYEKLGMKLIPNTRRLVALLNKIPTP